MDHSYKGAERRKFMRTFKSFSLFFYVKGSDDKKIDPTFIKDISKGGLRFTTSKSIKAGTHMIFEIGVPYIAPKRLIIEGVVISCKEISRLVHEIRAQFKFIDDQAKELLEMIEKQNLKDRKNYGLH